MACRRSLNTHWLKIVSDMSAAFLLVSLHSWPADIRSTRTENIVITEGTRNIHADSLAIGSLYFEISKIQMQQYVSMEYSPGFMFN